MYLPYLPPISWFSAMLQQRPVIIEREENFVKSTYRNRCEIAGANGKQILSIPIEGGRDHHQLYKNVRISYTSDWQRIHWNAIKSAYGSAPFFEHYAEKLQPFYEKQYELLFDYNYQLLRTVLAMVKPKQHTYDIQFTTQFLGGVIVPPSGVRGSYHQTFADRNGFIPDLSIIDLLFHEGPRAIEFI